MRLTQIKLSGFKSFADATVIRAPGQRVGVVGPNGCGKSNVIDAVRWVLGEASAKQLRGESMQDVIFNGAASRPPASRASVELVFDNSDFALAGAWGQYAEVAIKRSLNRRGESAYFINQQQVRRRDITDLFLGTGVGVRGYAVIEQGMISRIIEAKPEELRGFIEEAAGVSKYKERRRETEARLKETAANLTRLADVQGELDRQAEKLQRQAQTAARYRHIKAELTRAQNRLDYLLWQDALSEADRHMETHHTAQAAADALNTEQTALNEEIYRLQLREYALRNHETELSQQRATVREEAARLEEQIRHRQSARKRREREQVLAQSEIDQINIRLRTVQEKIAEESETAAYKQAFAEEVRAACENVAASLPALRQAVGAAGSAHDVLKNRLAQLKQQLALYRQQRERNRDEEQRLQQRLPADAAPQALPDFGAQSDALALLQLRHETMQARVAEEDGRLVAAQAALEAARARQQELDKERVALEAEHHALAAMMPEHEAADGDFWQHFPHIEAASLWRHLDADIAWQHALSVVLGERLYARHAPDFTPETCPSGRAAWINRDGGMSACLPDNALLQHVQADAPFKAALHCWLDGVLCADTLADAVARQSELRGAEYFLTPEGHRIDRAGVTLYGEYDAAPLLARRARLQDLDTARTALQPECEAAQAAVQACAEHGETARARLGEAQQLARHLAAQVQSAGDELFKARAAAEAQQLHHAQQVREKNQILADIARINEENALLDEQIEEVGIGLFESEDAALAAEETLTRARLQAEQAQHKVLEEERRAHQAQLSAQQAAQQLAALRQEADNLGARRIALQHKQDELALDGDEGGDDESTRQHRLDTLAQRQDALAQQLSALAQAQQQHKNALDAAHTQAQALSARLPAAQQQQQTAALAAQQAQLNGEHHRHNLQERGADIAALSEDAAHGLSAAALNQTVTDTARRLNHLGAVNLAALDELAETEARRDALQAQREDLHHAVAMLEAAIAQIDQESKTRFKQTFDAVNAHMQHYFPLLFGGGEAALTLTDSDLLHTGISINARPPGKKNSTIHLLSGGEKALTAMSLVFSLFSLNPAPFCLLDEVDAPLDDANTGRFCHLVTEMSAHTQFLYISHNRRTMEMAEQLIGVTMQEKGVSRIVSVDVREAVAMSA